MNLEAWVAIIGGCAASGIGAYLAIRVEIALLRYRMTRADEDRREYRAELAQQMKIQNERIDYAHERIDKLQRSRSDTIL